MDKSLPFQLYLKYLLLKFISRLGLFFKRFHGLLLIINWTCYWRIVKLCLIYLPTYNLKWRFEICLMFEDVICSLKALLGNVSLEKRRLRRLSGENRKKRKDFLGRWRVFWLGSPCVMKIIWGFIRGKRKGKLKRLIRELGVFGFWKV